MPLFHQFAVVVQPAVLPAGQVSGLDPILDQVGNSVSRTILPVIQNDRALQREIGLAAGQAIGQQLRPYALALVIIAGIGASALLYSALFGGNR